MKMDFNMEFERDTCTVNGNGGSFMLCDFPSEIIEKIFSYLKYQKISEIRCVCRSFDAICKRLLNQGFTKSERWHAAISKSVKNQLPRRESERRNHPLARHVDILSSIETRLSLLNMTYMRYIENGTCCFIPGKVLDELFKILHSILVSKELPKAHNFLLELRDISSMAMEHFDEKILPSLRTSFPCFSCERPSTPESASISSPLSSTSALLLMSRFSPREDIQLQSRMQNIMLLNKWKNSKAKQMSFMFELRECKNLIAEQARKLKEQEHEILEHETIIARQKQQLLKLDRKIQLNDEKITNIIKQFNDQEDCMATSSSTASSYTRVLKPSSSSSARVLRSSTLVRTTCSEAIVEAKETSNNRGRSRKHSITAVEAKPQSKKKRRS